MNNLPNDLPPEEIRNIQDSRISLLEKNYERLSDKVDAGFKELHKEMHKGFADIRVEMYGMIWKIPTILAVIMSVVGGIARGFHWL